MSQKIFTIGHATMDMILPCPHLPQTGETIVSPTGGIAYQAGGDGALLALCVAKLGSQSALAASLGADVHGQRLHALYREHGVVTTLIGVDPALPTGTHVVFLEENGNTSELVFPGANASLSSERIREGFQLGAKMVCVQMDIEESLVLSACQIAREKNIPILLFNAPRGGSFPMEQLPPVEIACFNEEETEALTGIRPIGESSALQALLSLSKRMTSAYYVIKMGARGSFLFDGVHRMMITPYAIKVVDAACGGIAYVGGMAHAYVSNGGDVVSACRYANAVSAVTLMQRGTVSSLPTGEEMSHFIARNGLK